MEVWGSYVQVHRDLDINLYLPNKGLSLEPLGMLEKASREHAAWFPKVQWLAVCQDNCGDHPRVPDNHDHAANAGDGWTLEEDTWSHVQT